jgi:hypothetical protein
MQGYHYAGFSWKFYNVRNEVELAGKFHTQNVKCAYTAHMAVELLTKYQVRHRNFFFTGTN